MRVGIFIIMLPDAIQIGEQPRRERELPLRVSFERLEEAVHNLHLQAPVSRFLTYARILFLTLLVAVIDFATGSEIRVYPLYFFPIALAAYSLGRTVALLSASVCTVLWVASNFLGGLEYSSGWIWVWNAAAQASAFGLVAVLVSRIQTARTHERETASVDGLTGLLNTRAFHERAAMVIGLCHRQSVPIVMAYVDLDHFKTVNDTQGHQRGDEILRLVARVMTEQSRSTDLVARM